MSDKKKTEEPVAPEKEIGTDESESIVPELDESDGAIEELEEKVEHLSEEAKVHFHAIVADMEAHIAQLDPHGYGGVRVLLDDFKAFKDRIRSFL